MLSVVIPGLQRESAHHPAPSEELQAMPATPGRQRADRRRQGNREVQQLIRRSLPHVSQAALNL